MPEVAWDIVMAAAGGSPAARRMLVERTMDGLWILAMRLTRRRDEAEDIIQETYTRALSTLGKLAPTGRFEGYLARIATNLVLERWRKRRPATLVDDAVLAAESPEPCDAVARDEEHRVRLAAVWAAVAELEPNQRAAVLLFYAQGLPYEEIAGVLDVPEGTIKTWLHRARNQIRLRAEDLLTRRQPCEHTQVGDAP